MTRLGLSARSFTKAPGVTKYVRLARPILPLSPLLVLAWLSVLSLVRIGLSEGRQEGRTGRGEVAHTTQPPRAAPVHRLGLTVRPSFVLLFFATYSQGVSHGAGAADHEGQHAGDKNILQKTMKPRHLQVSFLLQGLGGRAGGGFQGNGKRPAELTPALLFVSRPSRFADDCWFVFCFLAFARPSACPCSDVLTHLLLARSRARAVGGQSHVPPHPPSFVSASS